MLSACAAPLPVDSGGAEGGRPEAAKEDDYPYKKLTMLQLLEGGRPSDFYRLTFDGVPEVCGPVIDALNEPNRPPDGATHRDAKLLLESRLTVEWTNLDFTSGNEVARAEVDLHGDDQIETVYRFVHSYAKFSSHFLAWSEAVDEFTSEFSYDKLLAMLTTTGAFYRKEISRRELFQLEIAWESIQPFYLAEEARLGLWLDVAEIDAEYYVLAVNASYHRGEPFSGFVLKMSEGGIYEPICAFRTNYILTSR